MCSMAILFHKTICRMAGNTRCNFYQNYARISGCILIPYRIRSNGNIKAILFYFYCVALDYWRILNQFGCFLFGKKPHSFLLSRIVQIISYCVYLAGCRSNIYLISLFGVLTPSSNVILLSCSSISDSSCLPISFTSKES